jgi:hypothetical protein
MAVFAIIGISGIPLIQAKVIEQYPNDHFLLTPTAWLVSETGTARSVGDKITLSNGVLGATAMIVPAGAYHAWGPKGAWEWISAKTASAP